MSANAYSFLPWLRTGLTTQITEPPGTAPRATINVRLKLTGDALKDGDLPPSRPVEQPLQIYGPGDVIGVDPRAISRVEPLPYIATFEPNFLAHIEFYDEVFPWRYSPAPPDGATKRLAPWLALIVLAGTEFDDGAAPDRPLPFITVTDPRALQPSGELGAWAHVHVNGELDVPLAVDDPADMGAALANLGRVLREAPDSACSRVICPRHLSPKTNYDAFLVPAFETGRRAGLGIEPGAIAAMTPSWGVPQDVATGQLPYYHRWSFTTGSVGDFEYLVRLLKPFEAKDPVGRRDIDAHREPGFGLPGVTTPTKPDGVLRLGGALQLPDSDENPDAWENWDNYYKLRPLPWPQYPTQWQQAMAGLINLAEAYQRQPVATANAELAPRGSDLEGQTDPVITPPLYGRWHALTPQLLVDAEGDPVGDAVLHNWVHRLNLDPRFRVAAQFGAQVVQERQDELMAAAWNQLGEARRANEKIRAAQLAREVGNRLHDKHFDLPTTPLAATGSRDATGSRTAAEPLAAAEPPPLASARTLTLTAPAHGRVIERVPQALSALTDPGEQLAVGFKVARSRVAAAPVSAPMRRITRPGSRLMKVLEFPEVRPAETLVSRIDELHIAAAPSKGTPPAVVTPAELDERLPPKPPGHPVDVLALNPLFELRQYGETATTPVGDRDSDEAAAFKRALRELYAGWDEAAAGGHVADPPKLGVTDATTDMMTGLSSDKTVLDNLLASLNLPDRLRPATGELSELTEVMAYPVFDMPMYEDLLKMSVDTFVPNLGLIPANSITLLENNRRFIESYLVGLNHEMAREMLWREFPSDSRGTPFRQFWDPRTALPEPDEPARARRERLYDIPPIHKWSTATVLGGNSRRKNDLVLVIRGELLKKYPNAAIYAHKAAWPVLKDPPGTPDTSGERELARLPANLPPPPHLVKLPIYEARAEPDVYLLGFDLDADEARGEGGDLGWFFVIKERPGDPRFGVDEDPPGGPPPVEVWNDLSWGRVDPQDRHGFIQFDADIKVKLADEFNGDEDDQEKAEQRLDDEKILPGWQSDISSADVAYILFQAPVLVAVHAQEMLPDARPQS
ncbi:hypothetical protein E1287_02015 [Actinomadura sp. KC06]|uniref:hypothetical protein n=1 Tax=Actinomadura sp. KC06 TaxID=2530369 RepID=UPI0010484354|nr:hypothetical protein [Actinomadura sp. KC06]TDD39976.1 hypothetical protein E1287_02015 [Actinomadura sp. KC06]